MKVIKLDASRWTKAQDFYDAILPQLRSAPLVESMVWGEINAVELPFKIEVMSTRNLPSGVAEVSRYCLEHD